MSKQPAKQVRAKNPNGHPDISELGRGTRWQKGQSGNPDGSPRKPASITMAIREELARDAGNGKTKAQMIAAGMVEVALSPVGAVGAPRVLSEVLDRTEGKVTEEHNINLDTTVHFIIGKGYEKAKEKGE